MIAVRVTQVQASEASRASNVPAAASITPHLAPSGSDSWRSFLARGVDTDGSLPESWECVTGDSVFGSGGIVSGVTPTQSGVTSPSSEHALSGPMGMGSGRNG